MAVGGRMRNDLPSFPHPEKVSTSPFDFNPSSSVFSNVSAQHGLIQTISCYYFPGRNSPGPVFAKTGRLQGRKESLKDSRRTISNDPFGNVQASSIDQPGTWRWAAHASFKNGQSRHPRGW